MLGGWCSEEGLEDRVFFCGDRSVSGGGEKTEGMVGGWGGKEKNSLIWFRASPLHVACKRAYRPHAL